MSIIEKAVDRLVRSDPVRAPSAPGSEMQPGLDPDVGDTLESRGPKHVEKTPVVAPEVNLDDGSSTSKTV